MKKVKKLQAKIGRWLGLGEERKQSKKMR